MKAARQMGGDNLCSFLPGPYFSSHYFPGFFCIILGSATSKEMSLSMNTGYTCDRYDLFQQQTSCCHLFPVWRRIVLCLW